MTARDTQKLKAVEASLNSHYPSVQTMILSVDVTDETSVATLFEQVKSRFGHADILINNAAVNTGAGPIDETDAALWWRNFVRIARRT